MDHAKKLWISVLLAGLLIATPIARADAVIEWNNHVCEWAGPATFDTPTANRALAIMHTAIYLAVNSITKKYPDSELKVDAPPGASVDAAIAAASRSTLLQLVPSRSKDIESAYQESLAKVADERSRTAGIAVGERAAAVVLAARKDDGSSAVETYRPYTIPGVYVPTVLPLISQWPNRKPWFMSSASQFRPGPPPDLKSEIWARDYNEIKTIGKKVSSNRTPEQTAIATFWEATGPAIYHGLVRSYADKPSRDITENARLYMAVTQAMDDALISVFDAKYHYNFWRPVTAIRNGDIDGNDATARDPSWTPFITTPMHPEYPCAHCILSATVGTLLQAELGNGEMPVLSTKSPTAENKERKWAKLEDFILEVANGRIYDGVHFRNSTEVGTAMGRQIGNLAAERHFAVRKP